MPSTNSKSDNGPLDSIAFADERPKYKGVEPNNSLEKKLLGMIKGHFAGGSYEPINSSAAAMFQKFMEKGQYDDIFHEPEEETVYRGMCVPESWLIKAIGKIDADEGVIKKKFTFAPRNSVSSWTTSDSVAEDFSSYDVDNNFSFAEKCYSIIMKARVADNKNKLIDCVAGLYFVEDFIEYSVESETIALGPIKVYELEYKLAYDSSSWGAPVPKSTKKKSSKKTAVSKAKSVKSKKK